MTLATIADIAAECGVCPATIKTRLGNANVTPIERRLVSIVASDGRTRSFWAGYYDAEVLRALATYNPADGRRRHTDMRHAKCTRCPRYDYGNAARGGLCFDCYCHDNGKPFDKTGFAAIWDAVRANSCDVAAQNDATAEKTDNGQG